VAPGILVRIPSVVFLRRKDRGPLAGKLGSSRHPRGALSLEGNEMWHPDVKRGTRNYFACAAFCLRFCSM